jgi:hypothetical protein
MKYPCPQCSTVASGASGLRKHLGGRPRYGGHQLSPVQASMVIASIEDGTSLPAAEKSHQAEHPRAASLLQPSGVDTEMQQPIAAAALRGGHWNALALLEDTPHVHETLTAYEHALGHPVYLRPTNDGLTVISLDPARTSTVGVGGSASGACSISALPPTQAYLAAVVLAYNAKAAAMVKTSVEDRFVIAHIRRALGDGLRLRGDLLFLHQEWRFPGSGKIDLLALDTRRAQLVVIEAKRSEAAAKRERDKKGRSASDQALEYVGQLARHADEYFPYFERLLVALAHVYRDGAPVKLDRSQPPRWEVWWPEGRISTSTNLR